MTKVKNLISFAKYYFTMYKKDCLVLLINLILLVPAVTDVISNLKELKVSSVFLAVFVLFNLFWSVFGIIRDTQFYRQATLLTLTEISAPHEDTNASDNGDSAATTVYDPPHSIKPSVGEGKYGFHVIRRKITKSTSSTQFSFQSVCHSPEVDKKLAVSGDIDIHINDIYARRVTANIKRNKETLFPLLIYRFHKASGRTMFFNEKKLGMCSDIYDALRYKSVECHRSCYYHTYLTNIVSCTSAGDDSAGTVFDGSDYYPADRYQGEYHLKDIPSSFMSNEIGISTIAITRDNHIVLWIQSKNAQSSRGLLAPSGSGSCDWEDYHEGDSLQKTIIHAMNRELWEESGRANLGKTCDEIGETRLIGYFRWIEKGGKPEFVGVTKLNCGVYAVTPDEAEVYSGGRSLYGSNRQVHNGEQLLAVLKEMLEMPNISIPLFVNITSLIGYITDCSEEERLERLTFMLGENI